MAGLGEPLGRGRCLGLVLIRGDELAALDRPRHLAPRTVEFDGQVDRAETLLPDDALRHRVAGRVVTTALEVLGEVVGSIDTDADRLAALIAADVVVESVVAGSTRAASLAEEATENLVEDRHAASLRPQRRLDVPDEGDDVEHDQAEGQRAERHRALAWGDQLAQPAHPPEGDPGHRREEVPALRLQVGEIVADGFYRDRDDEQPGQHERTPRSGAELAPEAAP